MLANRLTVVRDQRGFTLVELLVVMLILSILAAIAIPAFFNQRDKAKDSKAKANGKSAEIAMETYQTNNNGSYVGATIAELEGIEATLVGATLTIDSVTADSYQVTSTSDTGATFTVARLATGEIVLSCAPAGTGGCKPTGTW